MVAEPVSAAEIVFVVDDDSSMRKALARLFRTVGLAAETFVSAEAFLLRAPCTGPCCAILDVRMPAVDGIALQERLQAAGRDLPIIFITGQGDVPSTVRGMKAGALDFIEKPFLSEDLLRAVRAALAESHSRLALSAQQGALERRASTLTAREREVFALVAQGLPNKIVGARLGTAEKTIKVHRGRVMKKMAASSLVELVRFAQRLGLGK